VEVVTAALVLVLLLEQQIEAVEVVVAHKAILEELAVQEL
jgi:hypothetical protein